MASANGDRAQLLAELGETRVRLKEALDTIEAIRSGGADALVESTGGEIFPISHKLFGEKTIFDQYRILLDSIGEGLVIIVPDGTTVYCNLPFAQAIGKPLESVVGADFRDFLKPDDVPRFEAFLERAHQGSAQVELDLIAAGREPMATQLSLRFAHIGKATWASMVVTDLTEQKRAQEQIRTLNAQLEARVVARTAELEAANKELESFSYSVSHDLRAPLRAIDGFGQALMEGFASKLGEQGQDYLQRIRANTQRMAALIEEMLKLARVSRTQIHSEVVDLSAMAKSILAELREGEPARQVECVVPDGILAHGDSGSLRLALENLLSNAWKFTSKKQRARIEFGLRWQNGEPVYFVRDDGAGFDMKYAGKLFGVFQRLHIEAEFPGLGVGLAIVQRVINRHGGRVWAEAVVEKGATFYFTLPESEPPRPRDVLERPHPS